LAAVRKSGHEPPGPLWGYAEVELERGQLRVPFGYALASTLEGDLHNCFIHWWPRGDGLSRSAGETQAYWRFQYLRTILARIPELPITRIGTTCLWDLILGANRYHEPKRDCLLLIKHKMNNLPDPVAPGEVHSKPIRPALLDFSDAFPAIARDTILAHCRSGRKLAIVRVEADPVFEVQKEADLRVAVISSVTNGSNHIFALHAGHDEF
jgi:hypothetical protein